jgi:hypothetical protein
MRPRRRASTAMGRRSAEASGLALLEFHSFEGTEKQGIVVAKWFANPSVGKRIAKATSKSEFNAMRNRSNGKSRMNWVISPDSESQLLLR